MKYVLVLLVTLVSNEPDQSFNIGDTAPEIVLQDLTGQPIKLSSLRGKVVLIDFWASWCKPCRKENPEIVKMYKKYKEEEFDNGQGFEVFSVSLDMAQQAWQNAVLKDNLTWTTHASDLKGWKSEAAKLYGVRALPQSYLIDGEGKIIAINPRGDKLEKELKKNKKSYSFFKSLFNW